MWIIHSGAEMLTEHHSD